MTAGPVGSDARGREHMKLIIQIPCYDEAATLPAVVADIPRRVPGFDRVEILVVDDGSSDDTVAVARRLGVDHVVRHRRNRGLAEAFRTGIDACLRRGADVIVNTDGDHQYPGRFIPALVAPILAGEAEIVIGDRQVSRNPRFSWVKRRLQVLGSFVVRRIARVRVPDAVSGFRAISREAAAQLNIVSAFSYTIEMLIQAGTRQMAIASVPIETNPVARSSRLFRSIPHFLSQSLATLVRIYAMYHPLRLFTYLGLGLFLAGSVPILRFLVYYVFIDGGVGKLQSLVIGSVLVVLGGVSVLFGVLADLINFNRRLLETTLHKVRLLELEREARSAGPDEAAAHGPAAEGRPALPFEARRDRAG